MIAAFFKRYLFVLLVFCILVVADAKRKGRKRQGNYKTKGEEGDYYRHSDSENYSESYSDYDEGQRVYTLRVNHPAVNTTYVGDGGGLESLSLSEATTTPISIHLDVSVSLCFPFFVFVFFFSLLFFSLYLCAFFTVFILLTAASCYG